MDYKKIILTNLFLLVTIVGFSQLDGSLFLGLTNATTSEMNSAVNVEKGAILYNTDVNEIYVYNGSSWVSNTKPSVYMGVLTITSTGNLSVTGLPFKPSQISFAAHANIESLYVGGNGNSINDISRFSSNSSCIGIRYSNQNGDNLGVTSASLASFNSNGFTINVGSHADNLVVIYQAYK